MMNAFGGEYWDVVYDQICLTGAEAKIITQVVNGRVGKLIFTSTASVYDPSANLIETDFDPTTFSESDQSAYEYQHGKRLAEKSFYRHLFQLSRFVFQW
jgi:nucleoside-diphosphate-sugar epimerase